ncbi:MAG TPA: GNAT family N-acetyltransferase [Solirubrobacteraceae bacterium]
MARVRVRPAAGDDADAIARIWIGGWRVAYRGLVPDRVIDALRPEDREALWRGRLTVADPGARTLVAVIDEQLVGYCRLALPSRDDDAGTGTCEIASLYVASDRRRGGIGRELLSVALAELETDGWAEVTLWVFSENTSARAFYASHGFEPDGRTGYDELCELDDIRLRARF